MNSKYLIVGLGNVGNCYKNTRHNVGFMAIDQILKKLNLDLNKSFFNGHYCNYLFENKNFYFAKPTTYMNLSGEFVLNFIKFYKIEIKNIIVIFDDIDMEVGKVRFRNSGSSGGQNGIKNIINLLKTDEIKRIKVGIGKPSNLKISEYVLSNFSNDEFNQIQIALDKVFFAIKDFIEFADFNRLVNNKFS